MKETRLEKAEVSQRNYEQGICVSQSMHLAFRAKSSLPLSLSDIEATRLRGIPETGTLRHSQEAWLYCSILPSLLCSICIHEASGQAYPMFTGGEEALKEQEEKQESLFETAE